MASEALTVRLPLYNSDGNEVPGYVEVDVRHFLSVMSRTRMVEASIGPSAKIVRFRDEDGTLL